MANVIREDVIKVSWDVEDNPFADIQRTIDGVTDGISDTVRDFSRLDRAADNAADSIRDISNAGRRISSSGVDNMSSELQEVAQNAGRAEQSVRDLAKTKMKELAGEIKDATKELFNLQDAADQATEKLSSGIGNALGVIGVAAGAGAAVNVATDYQKSINSIQAATGASKAEMEAYSESIQNLYKNNMGESFEDVAQSISVVNQITGQSGAGLETMTNNALLMRDTFGYDVTESVRSADMMMKQFGISSDEAYNLITQGAQTGLDKNGNLLDSVNEYAVHFKQLGFGADEMFNIFSNGAEMGVFDIDKLGDAMKEFGIRAIDGSDTTMEAFASIGMDAEKTAARFAAGGDSAKTAFQDTLTAIASIKDPMKQNEVGVALFGTMWEDLGSKAILAMGNTKGAIQGGTQALTAMSQVKYDDLGSALGAIGRSIQTDIVLPIVNEAMPSISTAVATAKIYIADFAAGIKGEAGAANTAFGQIGITVRQIGSVIGSVFSFVANNLNTILPIVGALTAAFMVYKAVITAITIAEKVKMAIDIAQKVATMASTAAQWALNSAFWACPITWIIAAVVALIAIIVLLVANWDKVKAGLIAVWEGIKSAFSAVVNFFKNAFSKLIEGVKALVNTIVNFVTSLVEKIKIGFQNMVTAVKTKVIEIKDGIVNKFNEIISFFKELPSKFLNFGKNIIDGLINGVKEKIGALKDTITGVGDKVGGWFKEKLGINSPSKVTTEMGVFVTQGLEVGMTDELTNLKKTAMNVGATTTTSVQKGTGIQSAYSNSTPSSLPATTTSTSNETNTYSPQFNATFYTNGSDRDAKSKFKRWFNEAIEDFVASTDRRSPRGTEV